MDDNRFFARKTLTLPYAPAWDDKRSHSYPQFFQTPQVTNVQVFINNQPYEQYKEDKKLAKIDEEEQKNEDKPQGKDKVDKCCNKFGSCLGSFINKIICGK